MPERPGGRPMPVGGSGATYDRGPQQGGHHPPATPPASTTRNGTKGTVSTSKKAGWITSGIGYATGIAPLKWAGTALSWLGGDRKSKPPKGHPETIAKSRIYKPVPVGGGPGDRDGTPQITLNTQSLASTAIPETKKSGWNFEAYQKGSTTQSRLYGKKGKMIKANQGEFSQGKRFGPPPNKGPDPQGINAPLNNVDYFKDLL